MGLHIPSADLPFKPCVEIGWRLAAKDGEKGYATEAAQAALAVGFEQLQLKEIVSFTALSNLRSQKMMERLGMKRDSETFIHPSVRNRVRSRNIAFTGSPGLIFPCRNSASHTLSVDLTLDADIEQLKSTSGCSSDDHRIIHARWYGLAWQGSDA